MKSDETIIPVILFTMYLYEQLFQNDELLFFSYLLHMAYYCNTVGVDLVGLKPNP